MHVSHGPPDLYVKDVTQGLLAGALTAMHKLIGR